MEGVKASLPQTLVREIESGLSSVESTCTALASHFSHNHVCFQLLQQLIEPGMTSCAKDRQTALDCKGEGNAAFGRASFKHALDCYTKGLRFISLNTQVDASHAATLLVNRASSLHRLELLDAAVQDCTRAIELQPDYAKAWYRRGRIQADLRNYENAIDDMKKVLSLESSVGGQKQVKQQMADLEILMSEMTVMDEASHMIPAVDSRKWEPRIMESVMDTSSTWTPEKQWGLSTEQNLEPGSLILQEAPYAAIVLKACRNSHCHYCFGQLPANPMACNTCAIPLYCTEACRDKALGCGSDRATGGSLHLQNNILSGEHKHECGGASWSAVLPTDAVLAARIFVRSQALGHLDNQLDGFCHHYENLSGMDKLDLHVLAVVMANVLKCNSGEATGNVAAKLVLLIARVRANAMAIVSISSPDAAVPMTELSAPDVSSSTSTLLSIEQVKVAQAVYVKASRMNHACDPNVHVSFQSRCLSARTIKSVLAGAPLEISYGPQLGEMFYEDRQAWLRERYCFTCKCSACKHITRSDLLLIALHCSKASCEGVVPGPAVSPATESEAFQRTLQKQAQCLGCGTLVDVATASIAAKESMEELERIKSELSSPSAGKNLKVMVAAVLHLLGCCRDVLHSSSKQLARVEDLVAQILCTADQPQDAISHCQTSIQILEQVYSQDHIAVANERLKLTSIAHAAGDTKCALLNLGIVDRIMRIHYGLHYSVMFPYIASLQQVLDTSGSVVKN
ncbi:hypothetical protein BDL97_02G021200 [Sphagnum fallax]|nr:hypothetical protein BDL97_02G021200 [Sphagnum fallax]